MRIVNHLLATFFLLLLLSPVVRGDDDEREFTEDDLIPFTWYERKYGGKLYRQYFISGRSGEYRVLTYVLDFATRKWEPGVSKQLADDVQKRAAHAKGETFTLGRTAAATVAEWLYVLDDYNVERIVVFDPVAGTVRARANLPFNRPVSMATNPQAPLLYVAHQAETGSFFPNHPPGITVFDKETNQIRRHQALPDTVAPHCCGQDFVLSPDNTLLYLVNTRGFSDPSSIEVYDAASLTRVASIPAPVGVTYQEVTLSPDGSLLCAVRSDSRVVLIDTLTNTVSAILVIGSPSAPVFHPNGSKIYLSRRTQIAVIDVASATVAESIPVAGAIEINQLIITPDGLDLFATDNQARKVFVLNPAARTLSQTLDSSPASDLVLVQ